MKNKPDQKLWEKRLKGIKLTKYGLEEVHRLYEHNWQMMRRYPHHQEYKRREHKLNTKEIRIRKAIGQYVHVPKERYKPRKYGGHNFFELFKQRLLTSGMRYDILNDIDGSSHESTGVESRYNVPDNYDNR